MGSDQRDEGGGGQPGVGNQLAGLLVEGGDLLPPPGPTGWTSRPPGASYSASGGGMRGEAAATPIAWWGVLGDAQGAVANHHRDPVQPDRGQVGPGLGGQVWEALDRHHLAGQQGQDGGLEPQSGAELPGPAGCWSAPSAASILAIRLGWVVTCPCGIRIGSSRYAWAVAAGGTNRVRGTWRKAVSTRRSRIPSARRTRTTSSGDPDPADGSADMVCRAQGAARPGRPEVG
jgi:hypothetical protein